MPRAGPEQEQVSYFRHFCSPVILLPYPTGFSFFDSVFLSPNKRGFCAARGMFFSVTYTTSSKCQFTCLKLCLKGAPFYNLQPFICFNHFSIGHMLADYDWDLRLRWWKLLDLGFLCEGLGLDYGYSSPKDVDLHSASPQCYANREQQ